jgi:hypothetical protein
MSGALRAIMTHLKLTNFCRLALRSYVQGDGRPLSPIETPLPHAFGHTVRLSQQTPALRPLVALKQGARATSDAVAAVAAGSAVYGDAEELPGADVASAGLLSTSLLRAVCRPLQAFRDAVSASLSEFSSALNLAPMPSPARHKLLISAAIRVNRARVALLHAMNDFFAKGRFADDHKLLLSNLDVRCAEWRAVVASLLHASPWCQVLVLFSLLHALTTVATSFIDMTTEARQLVRVWSRETP